MQRGEDWGRGRKKERERDRDREKRERKETKRDRERVERQKRLCLKTPGGEAEGPHRGRVGFFS